MKKKYSIESLTEIADGDKDFMRIVAKTFLEEIPPDLKTMEEKIKQIENDFKSFLIMRSTLTGDK
jgi:hypothetical protein